MKLVVLGSGTSVPHSQRASAAFWLETDAARLLLDVSADAMHRMAQERLDWPNLDAIWVSHFHLDHVGGLAPFLFATKWAPQTLSRRRSLHIYGAVGLEKLLKAFDEANHYNLFEQNFAIDVAEIEPGDNFQIVPGLAATTFSTPHTEESLAIRLTDARGLSLVYSSDTGYSDELIEFARGAELLLLECSFRKHKPVQSHLELADALAVAARCQPRRLVLTHLYPEWDGYDVAREAAKIWPGETIEAVDGLRIDV
ncbi:MAG TPA: MBL fold metallo-hydrolase [Pyrinomonadaceae bacterium]|nr:MBL fold metallo-hydrolase [Pyrinomonadaceae bacterium]